MGKGQVSAPMEWVKNQFAKLNRNMETANTNINANTASIKPRNLSSGVIIGGKNGGIVFDTFAAAMSSGERVTFNLTRTPLNPYCVNVTIVTKNSTATAIKDVIVDRPNKTIGVSLTGPAGNIRFCACYATWDDLS